MAELTGTPLGPCKIIYKNQDLGFTGENVVFRYSENHAPVNVAQLGTTNIDEILVGHTCEVEVELTRTQIATLASLIAGASGSGTGGDTIAVKNRIGCSNYGRAGHLILKPIACDGNANPTSTTWLNVWKATPKLDMEISFNNSDQRMYSVTFVGYPDLTGTPANRIWGVT
jgi:hypothetical protein